ncbi:MAG: SRPBCC family protein, partial [Chloroflexota bacterium]
TLKQVINKPAESVFASFEDGPAWKEWLGLDVEWTSEKPFGVGTTRTVRTGGQEIDETFLIWHAPYQMAFRFDRSSLPLAAFAEDYKLIPLNDSSCQLSWTYAYEWGGFLPSVMGRLFGAVFSRMGRNSLSKLAKMMESTDRFDQ